MNLHNNTTCIFFNDARTSPLREGTKAPALRPLGASQTFACRGLTGRVIVIVTRTLNEPLVDGIVWQDVW